LVDGVEVEEGALAAALADVAEGGRRSPGGHVRAWW
jgi:hypothetical protein